MKICPNCQYLNPEGFLFCEDCGENLVHARSIYTTPEAQPDLPHLHLTVDSASFTLTAGREWVVGRTDPERDEVPDVDLAAYGALDQGVSANHAVIYYDLVWYIEDLGSTNGTYVDGVRLPSYKRFPLGPDQYIRLGRMPLHIDESATAVLVATTDNLSR